MLSILLCIFFMCGLGDTAAEKDIPEFRAEVSEAIISQSTERLPTLNDETSVDYKINACILSQCSGSGESGSFKTLKLKHNTPLRPLKNFHREHAEAINNKQSFNSNFIKYSCGYYVYALKHILI